MKRQRPTGMKPWVPSWRPARLALFAALCPLIVAVEVFAGFIEGIGAVVEEWSHMAREWPPAAPSPSPAQEKEGK